LTYLTVEAVHTKNAPKILEKRFDLEVEWGMLGCPNEEERTVSSRKIQMSLRTY
jgi:hypothetical protein